MSSPGYLAAAIFVAAYLLIASDRFDKTKIALAGGALMIILGVVDQHTAFHGTHEVEGIDWNTIFLLMGMMIIVNITRRTGLFEWVAIKTAKIGRGRPIPILIGMMISTAILSAFLDNVTTVLLMVPTVIVIYEAMELDPVPFIIFVIMSSNIGGSLTLVGHPPNIMIASTTGFDFMDFIRINGPFVIGVFGMLLGFIWLWMRRRMTISEELRLRIMSFDETRAISDHRLLWRCLGVMAIVFVGFAIHGMIGLEPATIALAGGALLLLLYPDDTREPLEEIEWPTLFFFIGLFIMIAALTDTGVVRAVGMGMINATDGNLFALTLLVLVVTAVASALMDNIPFVAAMTALLRVVAPELHPDPASAATMAELLQHQSILPIWWALSLGAGLGGNLALIGASPNVVAAGIAKRSGHEVGFMRFLKYGVPITLPMIILAAGYLWLRFFM
ncbi:MAG: SLC13 family permease [Armatimonadota bacterium]|jgi:Na+/H+ antiporter NhaD/arsenite permease-like protein